MKKIHEEFRSRGLRLSVAESCTAGLVSHMLTALPGSSEFFDSSVVAYSTNAKRKLLGLKKSLIKECGVVSEEVARAMAEALRTKTGTDFTLAVTGIIGPESIEDKRVGLVYVAVSYEGGTQSKCFMFDGSREKIKNLASLSALDFLKDIVSQCT